MWFDGVRKPDTIYVASVSRGKDSTAMLRAIQLLGFPLDMIVSVDVWATKDIPAELPPMVAFKDEWDRKCLDTFGLPVTRLCAQKTQAWISRERESKSDDGECHSRCSYEDMFYNIKKSGKFTGTYNGFPLQIKAWCKKLKTEYVDLRGHILQHYFTEEQRKEITENGIPQREMDSLRLSETRRELVQHRPCFLTSPN